MGSLSIVRRFAARVLAWRCSSALEIAVQYQPNCDWCSNVTFGTTCIGVLEMYIIIGGRTRRTVLQLSCVGDLRCGEEVWGWC